MTAVCLCVTTVCDDCMPVRLCDGCVPVFPEKGRLQELVQRLERQFSSATADTEDLQRTLARQEQQIGQLDRLHGENKQLQQTCHQLELANTGTILI